MTLEGMTKVREAGVGGGRNLVFILQVKPWREEGVGA